MKNSLVQDILVTGFIDDSEDKTWGQSTKQTKIHEKELKQEAEIHRIKYNKKKNRLFATPNEITKECKYYGRTHMTGACPAIN